MSMLRILSTVKLSNIFKCLLPLSRQGIQDSYHALKILNPVFKYLPYWAKVRKKSIEIDYSFSLKVSLTRSILSVHWKSSSTVRSLSPIHVLSWLSPAREHIRCLHVRGHKQNASLSVCKLHHTQPVHAMSGTKNRTPLCLSVNTIIHSMSTWCQGPANTTHHQGIPK